MKKRENRKQSSIICPQNNYDCYKVLNVAFSSFNQYYDDGGILWRDAGGNMVTLSTHLYT
jgi:hypothetical protein